MPARAEPKPRLFIGSSSEGKEIASALALGLHEVAEVTMWENGFFGLGSGTLETLLDKAPEFDFAVMVFSADDPIVSRGERGVAPRDNVIFECGLFMAALGRTRAFIVHDKPAGLKLPTDLAGITRAVFDGNRSDGNLEAAVQPAAYLIRREIRSQGRRLASVRPSPAPGVPFSSRRKTVWMIGSSDELSEAQRRFTENLVDDLASHFARLRIRLVLGESELLRHAARRYRSSLAGMSEFVPNPIIIFGNLRRGDARSAFSDTIGYVPDIAIIIGGRTGRGRVAEEHAFAKESGIPVLTVRCAGGAAADLASTLPALQEDKPDVPLSALESAKIAAEIASAIERL